MHTSFLKGTNGEILDSFGSQANYQKHFSAMVYTIKSVMIEMWTAYF